MAKEYEPKEDRDNFNENWCLDFALHNTSELGIGATLDALEEWATNLLSQNADHPQPLPLPFAGRMPIPIPPNDGKLVPDEEALMNAVIEQGGGASEMFAVRFLGRVRGLRNAIQQGDNDMVIVCAMALGALAHELSTFQHYHLAESVYMGGRKGAGDSSQGRTPYATLRKLYDEQLTAGVKPKQARAVVAKKTGVASRTVRRAVTGH
jgi:hypothetical protein